MEFIPYDKESNISDGMSLSDITRAALMHMYQEKKPDASEADIASVRKEIDAFISGVKQWFEKTMLPIKATIKLAEKQYVSLSYPDEILADEIMRADNVDFLLGDNPEIRKFIDRAIDESANASLIKPYDALFKQIITAYKSELYDLAVLGFFAIIDGLLSDITMDRGSVKIKQRTEKAVNIEDIHVSADMEDINKVIQKVSLLRVAELLSESKPFSGAEPEILNRHWAMHGRTRTKKTQADCEKLILFIYGLINTAENTIEELS